MDAKGRRFDFYSDSGHGWLKVPKKELRKLHVEDRITSYSYMRGEYAYLEEDCDLGTFLQAFMETNPGVEPQFRHHSTDRYSRIRRYESYRK
jgi:hypothetical protein